MELMLAALALPPAYEAVLERGGGAALAAIGGLAMRAGVVRAGVGMLKSMVKGRKLVVRALVSEGEGAAGMEGYHETTKVVMMTARARAVKPALVDDGRKKKKRIDEAVGQVMDGVDGLDGLDG